MKGFPFGVDTQNPDIECSRQPCLPPLGKHGNQIAGFGWVIHLRLRSQRLLWLHTVGLSQYIPNSKCSVRYKGPRMVHLPVLESCPTASFGDVRIDFSSPFKRLPPCTSCG